MVGWGWSLLACVPDPVGSPASSRLMDLALSTQPLSPPFDPDQPNYAVVGAGIGIPHLTAVAADPLAAVVVFHETIDGQPIGVGPPDRAIDLGVGQRLRIEVSGGAGQQTYQIAVVPRRLPELSAAGPGPGGPGRWLVAPISGEYGAPSYLMAVDDAAVPVWYREIDGAGFDFKTGPGAITYLTTLADGYRAEVLSDDTLQIEDTWRMAPHPRFVWLQTDPHEFTLLGDGTRLVLGRGDRQLDLTDLGGSADHLLLDNLIQHLSADGGVLFEWTSYEGLDPADLPDLFLPPTPGRAELVHINAVSVDPMDGNYIVSARIPSQVFKLARHPTSFRGVDFAPGEIVWRLGGVGSSDFAFVDDDRAAGWQGFSGQHMARPIGEDRILLFDNAGNWDLGPVGDTRAVEYALDFDAGTATRIREWASPGSGDTACCGSAERIEGGHTVVGWGDLPVKIEGHPIATEFDDQGEVAIELFAEPGTFTYRVRKQPFVF